MTTRLVTLILSLALLHGLVTGKAFAQPPAPPLGFEGDALAWFSLRDGEDASAVEAFIETFPDSSYALQARKRLAELQAGLSGVFRDCPDCPEMTVIPAGTFRMGRSVGDSQQDGTVQILIPADAPAHAVTIGRPFAIGVAEVTADQFRAFQRQTGHGFKEKCWPPGNVVFHSVPGNHPAFCVSWRAALGYADWLGRRSGKPYRLPSEAEWEYAARAGASVDRPHASPCQIANLADRSAAEVFEDFSVAGCDDGQAFTAPVKSYRRNDFGLYDTLGNVWEWTQDEWHRTYAGAPADGTAWLGGTKGTTRLRVIRGGAWSTNPGMVTFTAREDANMGMRDDSIGFRVARDLE